jgi:hypothetical protein
MEILAATEILERVAAVYAALQTYQDKGLVQTAVRTPKRSFIAETPFTTAYHRAGNQFRFEFFVPPPTPMPHPMAVGTRQWIIFRSGNQIDEWSFLHIPIDTPLTLRLAVARASGVSSGSAHKIPALLMPEEIGGRTLTANADQAVRIDDASLSTGDCYRVQRVPQRRVGAVRQTLWIEKNTLLIRRVDDHREQEGLVMEGITTYEPVIDVPIPQGALDFNAPSDS